MLTLQEKPNIMKIKLNFWKLYNLFVVNTGVDLDCAGNITASDNKFPCGEDVIGWPYMLFMMKPGQTITAVGTVPTVAEMTTAMALSTAAKVIAIGPLYNGAITSEMLKVQGPDDLYEVVKEKIKITGELSNLADDVIDGLRQLNIRQRAQLCWSDSEGRFHGAKTGFRCAIYFPEPNRDFGAASKGKIMIEIEYFRKQTVTYVTALDAGYNDLNNA